MHIMDHIIGRDCHVGMSHREVIRHVISKMKDGWRTYRTMKREKRRELLRRCVDRHRQNVELYCYVMRGGRR